MIRFKVHGRAQPKGSRRHIVVRNGMGEIVKKNGRPVVNSIDDNPKGKDWAQQVASVANESVTRYWGEVMFCSAIFIIVSYYFQRPKGHFGTGRNSGSLRLSAPEYHLVKPDRDKLDRGLMDALKGVVYRDDSQVVATFSEKKWSNAGDWMEVWIFGDEESDFFANEIRAKFVASEIRAKMLP